MERRALKHWILAFIVGNPIRLRFPPTPTGKGVVFFDLEDEAGLKNVTYFDDLCQKFGHAMVLSQYVFIQRREEYPAFMATGFTAIAVSFSRIANQHQQPSSQQLSWLVIV